MLDIFAHTDLAHEAVFITVHPGQLAHVSKNVLKAICKLECVNVSQTVLHVRIDN
jgi:hypothetical protein